MGWPKSSFEFFHVTEKPKWTFDQPNITLAYNVNWNTSHFIFRFKYWIMYPMLYLFAVNLLLFYHAKSWLIGKDSDAGRDRGQEEKGMTEDEMAGWHHWLDGREFGWTPGVGDEQGGLACCNSWGPKESDTTEQLNWTELNTFLLTPVCVLNKWGNLSGF